MNADNSKLILEFPEIRLTQFASWLRDTYSSHGHGSASFSTTTHPNYPPEFTPQLTVPPKK